MVRLAAPISLAAVAIACDVLNVTDPGIYSDGTASPRIVTTYESSWVGQYEGSGEVRLLTTGTDYHDVGFCLDIWVDDALLYVDSYVRLLSSPLEFKEISDGTYSGGQPSGCAAGEGGVRFDGNSSIDDVTSQDSVVVLDWRESFFGVQRNMAMVIRRGEPDDFSAKIVVWRWPSGLEAARMVFSLSQTN